MADAVIVSMARSPIGRAGKGSLATLRADDLTAQMVRAALEQVPQLTPELIDDLILGTGNPAAESGFNMARVVSVLAGLPDVPGVTINRYCASSVQSTRMAMHAIKAGEGHCFISAGVEAVSRFAYGFADGTEGTENPLFDAARERTAALAAETIDRWEDPQLAGNLPDVYIAMGQTAENVAQAWDVSRADQDAFGLRSQQLTQEGLANGFWARDITPATLADGTVISKDDGPRSGVTLEGLSELKPVFRPNGTVTAGNCCALNDGAAALVVMSNTLAAQLGITPLARVVSTAVTGLSPEIMGMGPVEASRKALALAGMTIDDIDLVEINEAFAAQVLPSARELNVPMDKLNINGGAIAIGHPFGMTGARITSTLINSLQFHDKQFGLETMCVGGGQGMAMVLERLS